jgi:uncharacterized protein YjdB
MNLKKLLKKTKRTIAVLMALCICLQTGFLYEGSVSAEENEDEGEYTLAYSVHCQDIGWMSEVYDGETAGTSGQGKRLEAIKISVGNADTSGGITYRTHVQDHGWMDWVSDGEMSGTSGEGRRLEAIQIKLTGELAENYDVYYRVHCQDYGWLNWTKNGASAGTVGQAKRLEAIEIKLIEKSQDDTSNDTAGTGTPYASVTYRAHVQNNGWMDAVSDGAVAGTSGEAKRLEALNISVNSNISGDVIYEGHVQNYGWMSWVSNGENIGTEGEGKRLEAVKISLTGDLSENFDIYYRVHIQDYGWLDWASNGAAAGSAQLAKRVEAIQIKLVKKGNAAPGSTTRPFVDAASVKKTVLGPDDYVIKVNRQMNCVTVYKDGTPVKAMVCSVGSATPVGTFHIIERYRWRLMIHNVYAQYATRIVGSILFHSVPYTSQNNRTLQTEEYNKLGTTASAGCVRLSCEDAKWIYDNVANGATVIIYDSPDPGPLGKPTSIKIPAGQTWDPTDSEVK